MKRLITYVLNFNKELRINRLKRRLRLNNTVSLCYNIGVAYPENLKIEDYVHIGEGAKIHANGGVVIGRGTILGPEVTIYSANHKFKNAKAIPYDEEYIKKKVIIGENVWIGGQVIIVPGAEIGEGCIVGAGTVVSGKIEKYSIVVGNPCKVIGLRDEKEYIDLKKKDEIFLKRRYTKKI